MTMITRFLHWVGEKEAREIELELTEKINALKGEAFAKDSEINMLRDMVQSNEKRHMEDMVKIGKKIDLLTGSVSSLNRRLEDSEKARKNSDYMAEVFRQEVVILLESLPEVKLSDVEKQRQFREDIKKREREDELAEKD